MVALANSATFVPVVKVRASYKRSSKRFAELRAKVLPSGRYLPSLLSCANPLGITKKLVSKPAANMVQTMDLNLTMFIAINLCFKSCMVNLA